MHEPFSAEKFVRVWQKSDTAKEVAEALGISEVYARTRASQLRARGVPLKMMKPHWDKVDVEALTKLARELEK